MSADDRKHERGEHAPPARPGEEHAPHQPPETTTRRVPEQDRGGMQIGSWHLSNTGIGVVMVIVLTLFTYVAFNKQNIIPGHGYTLDATFRNAVNIREDSPVRIAGVDVGKVVGVERNGDYSTVTFTVTDEGRPVREDALVAMRPRILFEGNFFLDLAPGDPGAPELESGDTIPISRTSTSVQLDEVLGALKGDQRENLGKVLIEYGDSLQHKPTAAEDRTQDPEVKGKTGAQAINMLWAYGGAAGRESARVTTAFQGTAEHDLSRLIASSGKWFGAFVEREEALKDLITNYNTTIGAFASESANLTATVEKLGPTLDTAHRSFVNLDSSLPPLRRFSIEFEPAVAELPATIAAANPWIDATRPLLATPALGTVSASLRQATPNLAAAQTSGYGALGEIEALSKCATQTLIPTGNQVIDDQFSVGQPNYREFFYAATGIAGESQGFDGNGPFLRLQAGGGETLTQTSDPAPVPNQANNRVLYANTFEPPTGTQPLLAPAPQKMPKAACSAQPIPDLNGPSGGVGPPSPRAP